MNKRGDRRHARLRRNPYVILLAPPAVWLFVFFVIPLALIFIYSLLARNPDGSVAWSFVEQTADGGTRLTVWDNYRRILSPLADEFPPTYMMIVARSLWLAVLTTAICLFVGYPFAYALTRVSARWRNTLLLLVVIPFWTNFLIRTYAWRFILWKNGLLDVIVQAMGFGPFALHGTQAAVVIGLAYGYLPFMILPIYVTLERLDSSLVPAALDLGASPFAAFRKVTLPLSLPGIVAGSALVFIPSASAFVTPKLLGGAKSIMLGELIELQFKTVRDWPFGSAVGFVLMAVVLLTALVYFRAIRAEEI